MYTLGILHIFSCPYTYEQNVLVESRHHRIDENDLAFLHQASIPLLYWPYAISTRIYVMNKFPSSVLNGLCSLEMVYYKVPSLIY